MLSRCIDVKYSVFVPSFESEKTAKEREPKEQWPSAASGKLKSKLLSMKNKTRLQSGPALLCLMLRETVEMRREHGKTESG